MLRTAFLAWAALLPAAGQVSSLTGAWQLNVKKSTFAQARKPLNIVVHLEHNEPRLKYSGTIVYENDDTREFHFDGSIDGKEYPTMRSYGPGKVTLRRAGARTILSEYRSDDGRFAERAETTLSRDGKALTRRIRLKSPSGETAWTEVYERR